MFTYVIDIRYGGRMKRKHFVLHINSSFYIHGQKCVECVLMSCVCWLRDAGSLRIKNKRKHLCEEVKLQWKHSVVPPCTLVVYTVKIGHVRLTEHVSHSEMLFVGRRNWSVCVCVCVCVQQAAPKETRIIYLSEENKQRSKDEADPSLKALSQSLQCHHTVFPLPCTADTVQRSQQMSILCGHNLHRWFSYQWIREHISPVSEITKTSLNLLCLNWGDLHQCIFVCGQTWFLLF